MNKMLILLTTILLVLVISGCTENNNIPTGEVIATNNLQEITTIKVGVLMPFTTVRAEAGEYCKKGIELAKETISNQPNNRIIPEIIYEDSQYDATKAIAGYLKLRDIDNTNFVIGPYSSQETLAVGPLAEESQKILITPSAQSTAITHLGEYIFRTQISLVEEAPVLATYLMKNNITQLSILALNTEYANSFLPVFEKKYLALGGTIVRIQKYDVKDTDYRIYLTKIKSENTKHIVIIGTPKSAAQILVQAKELKLTNTFFATSPIEGQEFITAGKNATEGIIYTSPFDDASKVASMKKYRELYYEKYRQHPEMISANCYDSLMLLQQCFETYGTTTEEVKRCLYAVQDYPGASGIVTMDENGDVQKPIYIKTVKNQTFVKLENLENQ